MVCSNQRKGVNLKKLCKLLRARATKRSTGEKKGPNDRKCEECSQTIRKDGCLCISVSIIVPQFRIIYSVSLAQFLIS